MGLDIRHCKTGSARGAIGFLCGIAPGGEGGYTLIPELMTTLMSPAEVRASVWPFAAPAPTREVSFVYRRDHWKLEIIDALEKSVVKCLPENVSRKRGTDRVVVEIC